MAKTKRFHVLEGKEDNTAFRMGICMQCVSSLLDKHLGIWVERRPGLQPSDLVPFSGFLCLVVSKLGLW